VSSFVAYRLRRPYTFAIPWRDEIGTFSAIDAAIERCERHGAKRGLIVGPFAPDPADPDTHVTAPVNDTVYAIERLRR
jgi:hypothetical protein